MFKSDATMASSMYDGLYDSFSATLDRIEKIGHFADKELTILFGDSDSWASYLIDQGGITEWERSGRFEPDFLKNFLSILVKVNGLYEELTGRKMTALFPRSGKIHAHYSLREILGGGRRARADAPASSRPGC